MKEVLIKKEDLRIRKTRKLLTLALFDLLEKFPLEKISVIDICDTAMVHRATFYAHFEDKYHLLTYVIDEITEELFNKTIEMGNLTSIKQVYLNLTKSTLSFIEENKKSFVAMLNNNKTETIYGIILNAANRSIVFFMDKIRIKDELLIPRKIFLDFFSGGIANLALNFIISSKPYEINELMDYLGKIFDEKFILKQ